MLKHHTLKILFPLSNDHDHRVEHLLDPKDILQQPINNVIGLDDLLLFHLR